MSASPAAATRKKKKAAKSSAAPEASAARIEITPPPNVAVAPDGTRTPNAEAPILRTEGLVKIYKGRTVVNQVDLTVRRGEIVGLLGPNGAGKTTSFYMIVGIVPPNAGRIFFSGHDVTRLPMYRRARLGMGYLPQEESIFRKLTVEQNLLAILETRPLSRAERRARCDELLEQFGITHTAITKLRLLSTRTTPRLGCSVVNG